MYLYTVQKDTVNAIALSSVDTPVIESHTIRHLKSTEYGRGIAVNCILYKLVVAKSIQTLTHAQTIFQLLTTDRKNMVRPYNQC